MPKINILDKHVAELIAAGEVVERPSAVVKELVENAIDAGATAVTVEIKNGGISLIRITDNGSGFERDDIKNAFLRHATSKIKLESDLDAIHTLGFRGEALASISAVSRVELLTKTAEDSVGYRYTIEGGEEADFCEAGCPNGTTFIVRDLFYNTPARMKFLKKNSSEGTACAAIVDRIALSHPEVSIKFIREGKEELMTPGDSKLLSAVYAVCGREFSKDLLPLNYELEGVKAEGFVSAPVNARPSRGMQYFYINGRYVKTRTAMAAMEEACKGSVMVGKFPSCVMQLTINPHLVDVNVHPAKIEVRFANERPVFEAVYYAVKNALSGAGITEVKQNVFVPSMAAPTLPKTEQVTWDVPPKKADKPAAVQTVRDNQNFLNLGAAQTQGTSSLKQPNPPEQHKPDISPVEEAPTQAPSSLMPAPLDGEETGGVIYEEPLPEIPVSKEPEVPPFRLVGEAFETYIIIECGNELMLIDKHAAHERILYNKILEEQTIHSQMLLMPAEALLSHEEYEAVTNHKELIEKAGFEIEGQGGSFFVRAVPAYIDGAEAAEALVEIAAALMEHKQDIATQKQEWIFHSVACRAAIKAGQKSAPMELEALVKQVLGHDEVRHCPHGRPVTVTMKKSAIERQFGRI